MWKYEIYGSIIMCVGVGVWGVGCGEGGGRMWWGVGVGGGGGGLDWK